MLIGCHLFYDRQLYSFGRLETVEEVKEPVYPVETPIQEDKPPTMDDFFSF